MKTVNLKAMYNDPSQLREALAWRLFARAGLPASRHTYAKLALNDTYLGLFSVIEQVDRRYLKDRFGDHDEGNLYKAACGELGCATLERRVGPDGRDDGRQYVASRPDDQTYRLMTNEDDPAASTYEDLARRIRVVDGAGLPGGEARFEEPAYRGSVEEVFNARAFLRWAGVNVLLGSWDNYFATPSNHFLYNSGRRGDERGFGRGPGVRRAPRLPGSGLARVPTAGRSTATSRGVVAVGRYRGGGIRQGQAHRQDDRCRAKDQSIHVFTIPH